MGIKRSATYRALRGMAFRLLASRTLFGLLIKQERSCPHIYYVKVSPKKISHISLLPENSFGLSGPNAAYGAFTGCFDLLKRPFENQLLYRTVDQLMQGKSGSLTPQYKKLMQKEGEEKAVSQLEKLEYFIKVISNEGYLSQYQLGHTKIIQNIGEFEVPLHETIIGMDRNGKLFRIKGGRHRLAIAQHIDIPEMPAILTLYHQDAIELLPEKRRKITGASTDFMPF